MTQIAVGSILIALLSVGGPGIATAQTKDIVVVDSSKADYKEVMAGVSKAVLWGDPDKGPYGAFTRFAPGHKNSLHTHTNDLRLVVVKGAYVYQPEKGTERRITPGQYVLVPGGVRHMSGGDAKEGAVFYEESTGKFDVVPAK